MMPQVCKQFVIVVFPDHTHLLFLLSLFMRNNGKCNNSHAPSTGLDGIRLSLYTTKDF